MKDRDSVRGFPLSDAFTNPRTRAIESYYDKFRYNADGQLVAVPSGPIGGEFGKELDPSLRIPKYHVVEQDGYIWVWTGKNKPEGDPMDIASVGDYVWNQQTLLIEADPNLCLQLEMDWASSLSQNRLHWAHRRSIIPLRKSMTLEQPYEARTTDTGITIFQPPTNSAADEKLRQARTSTFYLPDRVIHQKLLKRPFWRGFGDFMSIAHFVPLVDPISGKVTTRAEYMWTPLVLPGYAFQRNKITTIPASIASIIPSHRKQDKRTLEALQSNINYWAAVDSLGTHPHFIPIEQETVAETNEGASTSVSPSHSLTNAAQAAFGPDCTFDSPSKAVLSIIQHHVNGTWDKDTAHSIVPTGRHVGIFRVTHADS